MRLLYVAATRAEDRLILSGAIDRKSLENLMTTDREQWLAWIWRALDLEPHSQSSVINIAGNAQIQITIDRELQSQTLVRPKSRHSKTEVEIDSTLEEIVPLL